MPRRAPARRRWPRTGKPPSSLPCGPRPRPAPATCGRGSGARWSTRPSPAAKPPVGSTNPAAPKPPPTTSITAVGGIEDRRDRESKPTPIEEELDRVGTALPARPHRYLRRRNAELADHLAHRPVGDAGATGRFLAASALGEQAADVALAELHLGGGQWHLRPALRDGRQRRGLWRG